MKLLSIILFSVLIATTALAQVPSTCFEIESILVDACAEGSSCNDNSAPACLCEGKNEMFRFVVGPDDLNVDDMYIDWPNGGNPWQGVCQGAGTASIIAELNEGILNCGFLVEPIGGILPAEKEVLMVTSTDMCVSANSFAGLADTLVVIFQCTGNFYGHFANQSNGSNNLRTIEVDFGAGCYDEVTYDRSLLVDQSGSNNAQDGARVDFTWAGIPSYHNDGCNAPVTQAEFDAGPNVVLCPGENIDLNAVLSSDYSDPFWSGGTGSFLDENDPATSYIPSGDEPAEFILQFTATGCNGLVSDEITVANLSNALTGIESSLGTTICDGEVTELTATGNAVLFEWSTGTFAPLIEVSEAGVYTVSVNNSCGLSEETIEIFLTAAPEVEIINPALEMICEGTSVQLNATANGPIEWSTAESTAFIMVSDAGWYYATVTNDCATVVDSVEVVVDSAPTVSILPDGPQYLCDGSSVELTTMGTEDVLYEWSTEESGTSITVTEIGTYWVTVSNDCGTSSDAVEVFNGGAVPVASILYDDDLVLCPDESLVLQGEGVGLYTWNDGSAEITYMVDAPGTYTLTVSNDCGTDEIAVEVISDETPEAIILDGPTLALCDENAITIQAFGTGVFTWFNFFEGNQQTVGVPGDYYVIATAACGTDTAFFNVVSETIVAQATASPIVGEAPLEVEFQNQTSNAITVYWILGQGATAFGEEASYTFNQEGNQEVVMQVTSANGCVDETSLFINVGACPFSIFVPSAFTPDDDRVNDLLRVEGNCIVKFEWQIFDRWGRAVYLSQDPDGRWNGADVSGYAVSNGVYPYVITVTDEQAETHRFTGSISVIR